MTVRLSFFEIINDQESNCKSEFTVWLEAVILITVSSSWASGRVGEPDVSSF